MRGALKQLMLSVLWLSAVNTTCAPFEKCSQGHGSASRGARSRGWSKQDSLSWSVATPFANVAFSCSDLLMQLDTDQLVGVTDPACPGLLIFSPFHRLGLFAEESKSSLDRGSAP